MIENTTDASPNAAALSQNAGAQTSHRTGFIVAGFAALFMTITQALGTGEVPFWTRLTYWLIVMMTGAIIGVGVTSGVQNWQRLRNQPIAEAIAIAVLIAAPLTLAVIGAGMVLLDMARPSFKGLLINFGLVALVSLAITGITYAIARGDKSKLAPIKSDAPTANAEAAHETAAFAATSDAVKTNPASADLATDARFRTRLPLRFQNAAILALQAEDHYLRVHTDIGEALILMRLSDAITELAVMGGAQTHRSWWVARSAVSKSTRGDGKGLLTLSNAIEAPVSRNYLRVLGDAGWFR
jgi:DNA-binding LytR/AlgR family response regulator